MNESIQEAISVRETERTKKKSSCKFDLQEVNEAIWHLVGIFDSKDHIPLFGCGEEVVKKSCAQSTKV